jgi:hypothetical protein
MKENDIIRLSHLSPFARGQMRICFVHPHDAAKCIKVASEDGKKRIKRARWRTLLFPWSLPILGQREFAECRCLFESGDEKIRRHIPRHFGFADTDLGRGAIFELIRNADGSIAPTLREKIKRGDAPSAALDEFRVFLREGRLWNWNDPGPGNVLCARLVGGGERLFVIDGLEQREFIPLAGLFPRLLGRRRAMRKARLFEARCARVIARNRKGYL